MSKIKVFLADDLLVVREGWKHIFHFVDDMEVVGESINTHETIRKVADIKPDVLLMDLKWFGDESAGWYTIKKIKVSTPEVKIIAVTAYENLIPDARRAGADAILLKTFTRNELLTLVRELFIAEPQQETLWDAQSSDENQFDNKIDDLTKRELEVLQLVAKGKRDKEIADILFISLATVKNHVKNVLGKLGASNRTQAAEIARKQGLLT